MCGSAAYKAGLHCVAQAASARACMLDCTDRVPPPHWLYRSPVMTGQKLKLNGNSRHCSTVTRFAENPAAHAKSCYGQEQANQGCYVIGKGTRMHHPSWQTCMGPSGKASRICGLRLVAEHSFVRDTHCRENICSLTCSRSACWPWVMASMVLKSLLKPARPSASMVSHMHTLHMSIASCWGLLSSISVRRAPTCATLGYAALNSCDTLHIALHTVLFCIHVDSEPCVYKSGT